MAEENPDIAVTVDDTPIERWLDEASAWLNSGQKNIAITVICGLSALMVSGGLIGWFHSRDFLVALLLLTWTLWRFQVSPEREGPTHTLLMMLGFVVTALAGTGAELWGIHYGYWAYHDLPEGRHFPYWLPIAWGGAFLFLCRVERRLLNNLDLRSPRVKILLVMAVASIFPTWGEIIAINLGAWTYTWGWQLFGVPLLAIVLLVALHTSIFLACSVLFRYFKVRDGLFNP